MSENTCCVQNIEKKRKLLVYFHPVLPAWQICEFELRSGRHKDATVGYIITGAANNKSALFPYKGDLCSGFREYGEEWPLTGHGQ